MARTYKRDKNGRFAGGGGSNKKPAKKTQQRGTNRIRRDNAGKIQGIGGTGATGRGGRLRTAKGNKRATVTMQAKGVTPQSAIKGRVKRDSGAMSKVSMARQPRKAGDDIQSAYQRQKRTRFKSTSITPDVSDKAPRFKAKASMTRKRANTVYGQQFVYGAGGERTRAPFGRFSTVKNPAPAKSFPSQAPGRTRQGELVARSGRRRRR